MKEPNADEKPAFLSNSAANLDMSTQEESKNNSQNLEPNFSKRTIRQLNRAKIVKENENLSDSKGLDLNFQNSSTTNISSYETILESQNEETEIP